MEFTVETADLTFALNAASAAMTGRSTLPILGNVKLEARGKELSISATNLDLFVSKKVPATVKKEGAVTAPHAILSRLTGRMESKTVSIVLSKKEITFKSGDTTAQIETLPSEDFPPDFKRDETAAVECDAENITKPFSKLIHSVSDDSQRYNMQGINLAPTEDGTELCATNAARIVFYRTIPLTKVNVIAPQLFVKAVLSIDPKGPVKLIVGDGVITLISQDVTVSSKLIEASFPGWKQAVPKRTEQAFSCGRKALISALETCAIFTQRQTPGLLIKGRGKEIEVSQPGKVEAMVLGTELSGQPDISIRLNSQWMIETLSVFEGENIRIQLVDNNSPIMIEEGPLTAVINRMVNP